MRNCEVGWKKYKILRQSKYFRAFKKAIAYRRRGEEVPKHLKWAIRKWEAGCIKAGIISGNIVKLKNSGITADVREKLEKVAELHFIEGKTYAEIATELGVATGTVKAWTSRHREYFNDTGNELLDEKRKEVVAKLESARLQSYAKYARMAKLADKKVEDTLSSPDTPPGVAFDAAKHVHEVVGVSPRATRERASSNPFSDDKKKLIADTLGIVFAAQEKAKELVGLPALEAEIEESVS